MRRADKEITSRAEIDAVVHGCVVCRLGFAVGNEPYVVPVSFGYDGRNLYFHTARTGRKIECIEANSRVCFEVERNVELIRDPGQPCEWSFAFESVIDSALAGPTMTPRPIRIHLVGTDTPMKLPCPQAPKAHLPGPTPARRTGVTCSGTLHQTTDTGGRR